MPFRRILISSFSIFVFAMCAVNAWAQGAVDQRALDELKLMSDTLTQAKTIQFQALSMVPMKTPAGPWVNLYETSKVVLQSPDKLFVGAGGDVAPNDFYFDGKTVTSYSPDKNIFAVRPGPATIDSMIDESYQGEGKSFPFADILVSEPYAVLTEDLINAFYVGQSTIDGVSTNHLAFSNENVEWQIWTGAEDHLPRLVVANYLDEAGEPSYTVEFKDWKLNEPVDENIFVFQNASSAAKVEFRRPKAQNQSEGVQS